MINQNTRNVFFLNSYNFLQQFPLKKLTMSWYYSCPNLKLQKSEAVVQRCSVKKVLLEISQNSQENTCASVCVINSTYILELSRHLTIFVYVLRVKQYVKYRSSRPEVFCKEGNLKNFAKSQESICFLITLQACFYDYQFFSVLRGMLHVGEVKFTPRWIFFFWDTSTFHLGLKTENFHPRVKWIFWPFCMIF